MILVDINLLLYAYDATLVKPTGWRSVILVEVRPVQSVFNSRYTLGTVNTIPSILSSTLT